MRIISQPLLLAFRIPPSARGRKMTKAFFFELINSKFLTPSKNSGKERMVFFPASFGLDQRLSSITS
jgi:hypothetical protein